MFTVRDRREARRQEKAHNDLPYTFVWNVGCAVTRGELPWFAFCISWIGAYLIPPFRQRRPLALSSYVGLHPRASDDEP